MDTSKFYLNSSLSDIRRERSRRGPDLEKTSVDFQAQHCIDWIRQNCRIQELGQVLLFDLYDYQEEFLRILMTQVAKARRGELVKAD